MYGADAYLLIETDGIIRIRKANLSARGRGESNRIRSIHRAFAENSEDAEYPDDLSAGPGKLLDDPIDLAG